MAEKKIKRVLLKLSGEALACGGNDIYDLDFVDKVAVSLLNCVKKGYEIAVVVGAGNIWRGRQGGEMDRTDADRMGMLATVINAICLKDAIIRVGGDAHVMTAVPMAPFAENYRAEDAVKYLESGSIVVFGAGLGIPFLSTDTTGAVRAAEISLTKSLLPREILPSSSRSPSVESLTSPSAAIALKNFEYLRVKIIPTTKTTGTRITIT